MVGGVSVKKISLIKGIRGYVRATSSLGGPSTGEEEKAFNMFLHEDKINKDSSLNINDIRKIANENNENSTNMGIEFYVGLAKRYGIDVYDTHEDTIKTYEKQEGNEDRLQVRHKEERDTEVTKETWRGKDRIATFIPGETNYNDEMFTPVNIVEGMLDLLPADIWTNPDIKFLDMYCKSGALLESIYWRLEEGLKDIIPNFMERSDHILTTQLYGLTVTEELASCYVRPIVYGTYKANHKRAFTNKFKDEEGNIKKAVRTIGDKIYGIKEAVMDSTHGMFKGIVKEAFGDMKFDVVVGNPPYNRGMDLDFVNKGFDLCEKYCLMITPAKWQTAEADQRVTSNMSYGEFRGKLVPHMSKVVFYPDCKDVFDIYQTDGITYYLLERSNKFDLCEVKNISKKRGIYNSTIRRSIRDSESLLNIGNEIIESMGRYEVFKFPYIEGTKRFAVMTNTQVSGYDWYIDDGARYVLSISRILDVGAGEEYSGTAKVIFESDSRAECESFISWLNTRFTRFFLVPNISKLTGVLTDHYFRFVPAPPTNSSGNTWDHTYTDEELYKAFNLPQKYIDIIEALIKERK